MIWQLAIDANDPARLADFWRRALDLTSRPPAGDEPWQRHYRGRVGPSGEFADRLFDPAGRFPPIWFQPVPEEKAGKNRLHLDLYVTGRDDTLSLDEREALVERHVERLVAWGASIAHRHRSDVPEDPYLFVTLRDPEGNEFCVA